MRCLGRLILLVVLVLAAGVAWLYREDLERWSDRQIHPAAATARIGRPSAGALRSAAAKLDSLQRTRPDSVILTASELAALLARGTSLLPGTTFDSISIELGDRAVRIRTLVDSVNVPASVRPLIPGARRRYEELVVRGALTPVRAGLAELDLEHVSLAGIPMPGAIISRLAARVAGKESDGRLDVVLPETVGGFRVHPDGVAIYRQGPIQ